MDSANAQNNFEVDTKGGDNTMSKTIIDKRFYNLLLVYNFAKDRLIKEFKNELFVNNLTIYFFCENIPGAYFVRKTNGRLFYDEDLNDDYFSFSDSTLEDIADKIREIVLTTINNKTKTFSSYSEFIEWCLQKV